MHCLAEETRARWHLSRVGDRVYPLPWNYESPGPMKNFAQALRKLKLP